MSVKPRHNIFKITALLLVITLVIPSIVKLSHAFAQHKHEVCFGEAEAHFHNLNLDCEFYKFKLNNNYYQAIEVATVTPTINIQKNNTSYYFFLITHQQDSYYLRGPPSLV